MTDAEKIKLLKLALRRIAEWEVRADRRKKGMVGVEEVEALRRYARVALRVVAGEIS